MKKSKNLYVSDLDKTLLNDQGKLSFFAEKNLNNFIKLGVNFSIATARSIQTVQNIFKNVPMNLPIIEFNGSFISDLNSGEHVVTNDINKHSLDTIQKLLEREDIFYYLSSFNGIEDKLYYENLENEGQLWYEENRRLDGDPRLEQSSNMKGHLKEKVVCFTIINKREHLENLEKKLLLLNEPVEMHIQENVYSPGWYWLTIHSVKSSKDLAIRDLMKLENIEDSQIICFGDNTNDIKMIQNAHIGIAVENALEELKNKADQVIGPNTSDSVIRFIARNEKIALLE